MKIIMSFWSEPYLRGFANEFIQDATWKLSWLLSVNAITKTYGKPILYTDAYGKKLLVDELKLEFEEVHTDLDNLPKEFSRFYTLGRTYACAQQKERFLHIDYDAFVYEKLPNDIADADVIFEKRFVYINNSNTFTLCKPQLFASCKNLPSWWNNYAQQTTYDYSSLGIVGGNNFDFFKMFDATINQILQDNRDVLANDAMRFSSEFYSSKLFFAQYTLDQYVSHNLSKRMNLQARYVVSPNNISNIKYAHTFTDKSIHADLHGRIARRLITDYAETAPQVAKICNKEYAIPSVDVIVIPNQYSSVYENVIRTLIPRNIKPHNVFVSEYLMIPNDKKLLSKIDDVRLIPHGKDYAASLQIALSRCTSDLVMLLDGHVRIFKLFIEKIIAAHFDNPDSVFCAVAKDFKNQTTCYGANQIDGKFVPNLDAKTNILDNIKVDGLYGGCYVFPRKILLDILKEINYENLDSISLALKEKSIPIYCVKNIEVSHNKKI